jgi:hypothetical protein
MKVALIAPKASEPNATEPFGERCRYGSRSFCCGLTPSCRGDLGIATTREVSSRTESFVHTLVPSLRDPSLPGRCAYRS